MFFRELGQFTPLATSGQGTAAQPYLFPSKINIQQSSIINSSSATPLATSGRGAAAQPYLFHRPPTTDNRQPTTDHRPPTTDHRPGKRKNLPSGYLEKRARSDTAQRRIRFSENLRASCEHRIDDPEKKGYVFIFSSANAHFPSSENTHQALPKNFFSPPLVDHDLFYPHSRKKAKSK
jgi:hypothetical protein